MHDKRINCWQIGDLPGHLAALQGTGTVRLSDNAGNRVAPPNTSDKARALDLLLANAVRGMEPSSITLFGVGLAGIGFARGRRSA